MKKITRVQVNVILTLMFVIFIIPLSYIKRILSIITIGKNKTDKEDSFWKTKNKNKNIMKWAREL